MPSFITYHQVKSIVNFMAQHPELTASILQCLEDKCHSKPILEELTKILNNCRESTSKQTETWAKYLSDIKNKVMGKAHPSKEYSPKGKLMEDDKSLTPWEKQGLGVLEDRMDWDKNQTTRRSTRKIRPPQGITVRQDRSSSTQQIYTTQSHGNVYPLGCLLPGVDRGSSGNESDDEQEYPAPITDASKSLREIERKLADAEITRAKADEHRAYTDMRRAEACATQAEALMKLAQAASDQACALVRIANAMEKCGKEKSA